MNFRILINNGQRGPFRYVCLRWPNFFLASKSLAFDALNNILLLIIDADYPISRTPAILQLKVNVLSYHTAHTHLYQHHPQKLPSKHTQNSPKFGLLFKQTTNVQPGSHRLFTSDELCIFSCRWRMMAYGLKNVGRHS